MGAGHARSGCYTAGVIERLRSVLADDPRIAYALLFGSRGRDAAHADSDTDVAVGLAAGAKLSVTDIGDLVSRLEQATGGGVDLVLLDEARPALAYRVFRDGKLVLEKDHRALVARKARAILEYLDFQPIEKALARGVLESIHHG